MIKNATEDRLFFGIIPDAASADRIFRMAGILKRAYGFAGNLIRPDRLHVSLFFLGGLPAQAVGAACTALAEVRMPPFEVVFDRSMSFRDRVGNRPFVLIGDDGPTQLKTFRQLLGTTLTRNGLRRRVNTNFTPHVTLLYDTNSVEEHPVDPVAWTVNEFVLIRSAGGHERLMQWPLRT